MRIAIIGAGWYGCHLGVCLQGEHAVDIYESEDDIFAKSSGLNQGRLHRGFHYPRSRATRRQASDNFSRFLSSYKEFTLPIAENIYAVAQDASHTDFTTFIATMREDGLPFEHVDPLRYGLQNVAGSIRCDERVIDVQRCKASFRAALGHCLRLQTPVHTVSVEDTHVMVNGESYDYCIDCTNNQSSFAVPGTTYEACVMLLYEGFSPDLGLTIMDGQFCSLYPCIHGGTTMHVLTTVTHTPIAISHDLREARNALNGIDREIVDRLRPSFEASINTFYPAFKEHARYRGFLTSIKTKVANDDACRRLSVHARGRHIQVHCGKIASIFSAEDAIRSLIHA